MTAYRKRLSHPSSLATLRADGTKRDKKPGDPSNPTRLASEGSVPATGVAGKAEIARSKEQVIRSRRGTSTHAACGSLRCPSVNPFVVLRPATPYSFRMENVSRSQTRPHNSIVAGATPPRRFAEPVCDNSGYAVFSDGEIGAMHVLAHRFLDSRAPQRGHQILEQWLAVRSGHGPRWIHIQWHMAVFELALGHWQAALNRFWKFILPAVLTSDDALTDAPALLWRLALETPKQVSLPWDCVRDRALLSLKGQSSAFVTLHNLLALAGAGAIEHLEAWIRDQNTRPRATRKNTVVRFAAALRSFVAEDFAAAASDLTALAPTVTRIGGSRAQNEIFLKIRDAARRKVAIETRASRFLQAA